MQAVLSAMGKNIVHCGDAGAGGKNCLFYLLRKLQLTVPSTRCLFVSCFVPTVYTGVAKLCNNLSLAIQMVATSEAMNLGVQMGMDPVVLAGVLNTSTGR